MKNPSMSIRLARTEREIANCYPAMSELRPHLLEKEFVDLIKSMKNEGYELAYLQIEEEIVSVMGFRYLRFLHIGRHYYIDDLSTKAAHRGKGFGKKLLEWLESKAIEKGFNAITLDSGYQRYGAHKLYLNQGFQIRSHHFVKTLK
jgi:GNAT superfamily N-acetyltransferase